MTENLENVNEEKEPPIGAGGERRWAFPPAQPPKPRARGLLGSTVYAQEGPAGSGGTREPGSWFETGARKAVHPAVPQPARGSVPRTLLPQCPAHGHRSAQSVQCDASTSENKTYSSNKTPDAPA